MSGVHYLTEKGVNIEGTAEKQISDVKLTLLKHLGLGCIVEGQGQTFLDYHRDSISAIFFITFACTSQKRLSSNNLIRMRTPMNSY